MLKKLYDKSKIWFAVAWIIAYCVLMSAGDSLSVVAGTQKSVTLAVGLFLSAALLLFLRKHALFEAYGLCPSKVPPRSMLFYLPVLKSRPRKMTSSKNPTQTIDSMYSTVSTAP